jgi:DNA-binding CsgD family transcriptional regulator
MPQQMITVAIGAGSQIDRAGLTALVASLPGLRTVALDTVPPPRVLVWDGDVEDLAGLPEPRPGTVLLLLVPGDEYPALTSNIAGVISKDETPEALGAAIRQVARGEQYLSPSLVLALLRRRAVSAASPGDNPVSDERSGHTLPALTDREREIMVLLAEGLSNKAIAARMYLSVRTVEGHLAKLYARLGVHTRTEAVLIAIQHRSMLKNE